MKASTALERLKTAQAPDRNLDIIIAQVVGWKRREEDFTDPSTKERKKRVLWIIPDGDDAGRIPYYTSRIDDAWNFALSVNPEHVGGCSWEPSLASAKIGDGPYFQAAHPAIAICMAVLDILKKQSENR